METFSTLLAIWAGNSPSPGEFPAQRPVTQSFDVFFDLRLNKRLSKQWWGWWYETLSRPLWRHHNDKHQYTEGVINMHLYVAQAELFPGAESGVSAFQRRGSAVRRYNSDIKYIFLVFLCV